MPRELWKQVLIRALTTGQGLANNDDPNWEAGDEFHAMVALNARLACRELSELTDAVCPLLDADWWHSKLGHILASGRIKGDLMNTYLRFIGKEFGAVGKLTLRLIALDELLQGLQWDRIKEYLTSFAHASHQGQVNHVWFKALSLPNGQAFAHWLQTTFPAPPVYKLRAEVQLSARVRAVEE